ncbi:MAG TPA: adenylate/guanylate cyclase domain-containing protein, partial [Blastocatellia bacterium]|nr:adenylate/guanylate cyclase domain-containing protein [Blastocatellia bacterium]
VTDNVTGHSFEFDLSKDETRLGRAAYRNDLLLNDSQVSREHAIIRRTGNAYTLIDLESANGTFVNGERIREYPLNDNDVFTISKYTIRFRKEGSGLSVRYEDKKIGNTVLLRSPEQVATMLPQQSAAGIAALAPGEVQDDIEMLRKKAETLARIYELNKILGSVFSLEDIFKKVSEMLFRLTPADRFIILLRDAATGELTPFAAESRRQDLQLGEELSVSKTVVDRVIAERVSLLSFDARADDRLASSASIIMQNIQSIMCAPLLGKDGVLGVIYVDCRELMKVFKADDLDLLNALAAETSIAVENAITHKQLLREELARAKYGRFMPRHVVDEILKNPETLSLGGSNKVVTMLFSDVRGFTTMSETLPPETVVQILNEYFAEMSPLVFEHQGLLDKYMGDGLMALFGVPYSSADAAANAISAAIAMQRRMANVNSDLRERGLSEIAIGIGINTGTVTVGYIGSEERTDYTAIGDPVNLAARLEKQAQGGQIIISRTTLEAAGNRFPVKPSGEVFVKGKREPVQIYEVLWQIA